MNNFIKTEKPLSEAELNETASLLNIKLPGELKAHYLRFNGGIPEKNCWWVDDYVYYEIARFRSVKYKNGVVSDEKFATLENTYLNRVKDGILPPNYLSFAYDHGGNYFCINLDNNDIVIIFFDLGEIIGNPDAIRVLTNGFNHFVDELKEAEDEEDV